MQALIGQQLINKLVPEPKPYEVHDTRVKGFLVRVQPSGIMSSIVQYARGKRITIGQTSVLTPVQARDRAKEILADVVANGVDPQQEKRERKAGNFKEYLDNEYAPWAMAHRKDGKATVARVRACFAELYDRKLGEITPDVVERWRTARLNKGVKAATLNRDLTALNGCLSMPVKWRLLAEHPLHDVDDPTWMTRPRSGS